MEAAQSLHLEHFAEPAFPGFATSLGDPGAWSVRAYRRLVTAFHALRVADAVLCRPTSVAPLRATLIASLADDDASGRVQDPLFESLVWPTRALDIARVLAAETSPLRLIDDLEGLARGFRSDGQFALGADVYMTLAMATAHRETDQRVRWVRESASLTLGAGLLTRAERLLDWLRAMVEAGAEYAESAALTVEAQLYFHQGTLGDAARVAQCASDVAEFTRSGDAISRAQHILGVTLGVQNRHEDAAVAFFAAYRAAPDAEFSYWTLVSLAHALFRLGRDRSAEDGCRLLLAHPLSVAQRATVLNTMLCIAARRGDRRLVDEFRASAEELLVRGKTEPQLDTMIWLSIGAAMWRFGELAEARRAWGQGLAIAEASRVNRQIIRFDSALRENRPPEGLLGPEPLPLLTDGSAVLPSTLHEHPGVARVESALQADRRRLRAARSTT